MNRFQFSGYLDSPWTSKNLSMPPIVCIGCSEGLLESDGVHFEFEE